MPSIVPAAIGLGGSIFSGISGKRAAKKQAQQAAEQYAMLKPLLEAQVKGGQQAIQTGNQQIGQGAGYLSGAQTGLQDLKKFWQPLVSGDRSAIDAFLAPERRAINQGYQATAQNMFRMAPRGGGRVSALANADMNRQGALNDLVFGARREGANQMKDLNQSQGQLGLGQMGVGANVLGQGLNAGQTLAGIYGNQTSRADRASAGAGQQLGALGQSLGGFLADLFQPKRSGGGTGWGSLDKFLGGN